MCYFENAFRFESLIGGARTALDGVEFDTFVGIGLSGTIAASVLAAAFNKRLAIVRKEDDLSTHSGNRVEGDRMGRWLFVDDFVCSGRTFEYVVRQYGRLGYFAGAYLYVHGAGGRGMYADAAGFLAMIDRRVKERVIA